MWLTDNQDKTDQAKRRHDDAIGKRVKAQLDAFVSDAQEEHEHENKLMAFLPRGWYLDLTDGTVKEGTKPEKKPSCPTNKPKFDKTYNTAQQGIEPRLRRCHAQRTPHRPY